LGTKEEQMMNEGTWIEPDRTVHVLGRLTHDEWACDWLKEHAVYPTNAAVAAAVLSNATKPDAGPAFFELLRRRWVRQRGRVFTTWRLDAESRAVIAMGAARSGFDSVLVEIRNDREVLFLGRMEVRNLVSKKSASRRGTAQEQPN
jgi:hypothetical protein